jgi:amidohydrolase
MRKIVFTPKQIIGLLHLVILLAASLIARAQTDEALLKKVAEMSYADSARLTTIYKDLHTHPELGFMETRTAAIVAKELTGIGYKVYTGIGKTGVIGILKNGDGPTVMFRGDMDALPVKEITGLSYASEVSVKLPEGNTVPVMHACGHDAHVTWLLGIARVMKTIQQDWKGTLIILAQPAEEKILGAQAMHDDSVYIKDIPVPDYLLGMHTMPFGLGTVFNLPGTRMAGSDQLDVTFHGIGGHGSAPQNAKDPIIMASEAIMQYQTIVSRSVNPQTPAVLTVGSVQAGDANNVIPPSALVKINLRWFTKETRNILFSSIYRIDSGIAMSNGLVPSMYPTNVTKGFCMPLVNDTSLTAKVNAALTPFLPKGTLITSGFPAAMGSEDFQHLVLGNNKTICDYLFIGTAPMDKFMAARKEGKDFPFYNHNGNYMVDLGGLPFGVKVGTVALLSAFKMPRISG